MNVSAWCNHNARRASPGFRPAFEPRPEDTVEIPGILVTEGDDAADAVLRHLEGEHLQEAQR